MEEAESLFEIMDVNHSIPTGFGDPKISEFEDFVGVEGLGIRIWLQGFRA